MIRRYRECHASSWNEEPAEILSSLLPLMPGSGNGQIAPLSTYQTHLLHLASDGEILPHVDNLQASGGKLGRFCCLSPSFLAF